MAYNKQLNKSQLIKPLPSVISNEAMIEQKQLLGAADVYNIN